MPKIKKIYKKLEHAVKDAAHDIAESVKHNVISDKHERAHNCLEKLQNDKIKLCFTNTGQEIENYEQINGLSIARQSIGEKFREYCLEELANGGVEDCSKLAAYRAHVAGNIAELVESVTNSFSGDANASSHAEL